MPYDQDELKDKLNEIEDRNYNFVQIKRDYSAELQLLGSRNNLAYNIFCFFCLNMDEYNRIKCTTENIMKIFQVKSKKTIIKGIKELYECGFLDKVKNGTTNIYHINKNLSWQKGKKAREELQQDKNMFIRFKEYQSNNIKELKAIRQIQNKIKAINKTII